MQPQVVSLLKVRRRAEAKADSSLILDAEDLTLNKLSIDGNELTTRCPLS